MKDFIVFVCLAILVVAVITYDKWSYKQWHKRCERDVVPFTGKTRKELEQ